MDRSRALRLAVRLIVLTLLTITHGAAGAETVSLRGVILDADSDSPLIGASIRIQTQDGQPLGAMSDQNGEFAIKAVPAGTYTLKVTYIGYQDYLLPAFELSGLRSEVLQLRLKPTSLAIEGVTVSSVSRRPEKALEAPAAVTVISSEDIAKRPSLTAIEHVKAVPAVDVATAGLGQYRTVVRGFNAVFSSRLLMMADHRYARLPSLDLNAAELVPSNNLDIDRIEVVSGPGSALYGPNAIGGVMHIITKSPFDDPGTMVSVGGGERSFVTGAFRHAQVLTDKVAFKVSGEYYQGTDWKSTDAAEPDSLIRGVQTLQGRVAQGGLVSNARDFDVDNLNLDARIDARLGEELTAVLSSGTSRNSSNRLTGAGVFELKDWQYSYLQGRVTYRDLFVQAFVNQSGDGDTYSRRTGDTVLDESRLYVIQGQHSSTTWKDRQHFTYGLDLLLTRPETKQTIHGRNEDDDSVDEFGIYLQSETALNDELKAVLAARIDDHSELEDRNFSPRAALVFTPRSNHSFRATFNRAFAPPTAPALFVDINIAPDLQGLPYRIQLRGIPKTGWSIRRDVSGGVGGMYMTSPFTPVSEGGAGHQLPADATARWDAVVAVMGGVGVDLTALPAPTTEDVSTDLGVLNLSTQAYDPILPEEIVDIQPFKPTVNNTIEVGYKGALGDRLLLQADFYRSENEDFLDPLIVLTPNVFFNAASLTAYLSQFMSEAEAGALAAGIAAIPVGTVTPEEGDPTDILLTVRNFGDITVYGVDFGFTYFPDDTWTLRGNYSFVSDDFFAKSLPQQPFDLALNAPKHKLSGSVRYTDSGRGWSAELRPRYASSFPVDSVPFKGEVDSYFTIDLLGTYQWPEWNTMLSVSVQNVLDNQHEEFIGTPEIGRLAVVRLTQAF